MGWLGDLLGGLEAAGGIIAAPFTGGATIPLIGSGVSTIVGSNGPSPASSALAGAATGAANQQNEQNALENAYNNSLVGEYGQQLNQANLENQAAVGNPARFAGQSALADIASGRGRVGGSAVNLSPGTLATLEALQGSNAANEANSGTVNPVPSISAVHAPTLTQPSQSTLGSVLGGASLASSILPGILNAIHPGQGNASLGAPQGPTEAQAGWVQNPDGSWSPPPQAGSAFDNPGLGNQDLLG